MTFSLIRFGSSGRAGEPIKKRMNPPAKSAYPEAAFDPMVGFILPKIMMPIEPNRVEVRMRNAPSMGLLAPLPGE